MIPTVERCLQLMEKYHMLENIKEHSIVVAKVAKIIGTGLKNSGFDISLPLVIAGALLHDIGKTISLQYGGDHSKIGYEICIENSLYEVAEIVKEHVRLKSFDMNGPCNEKEIVYYADKRVNHAQVVSIDERLAYVLERYAYNRDGALAAAIKKNFAICKQTEKKLFKYLPFSPGDLPKMVSQTKLVDDFTDAPHDKSTNQIRF